MPQIYRFAAILQSVNHFSNSKGRDSNSVRATRMCTNLSSLGFAAYPAALFKLGWSRRSGVATTAHCYAGSQTRPPKTLQPPVLWRNLPCSTASLHTTAKYTGRRKSKRSAEMRLRGASLTQGCWQLTRTCFARLSFQFNSLVQDYATQKKVPMDSSYGLEREGVSGRRIR